MACRITELCVLCFNCTEVCPKGAIQEQDGRIVIDPKKCNECAGHRVGPRCQQICPEKGALVRESAP